MSEREILLKKLSTYSFATFDLHLYLDTHPNDKEIAQKLEDYRVKAIELRNEFESKYGPLTISQDNANRWAWIQNPWPWEAD